MVTINNDIPVYAEQITVNQEVEQIQEILNKFDQLVPEDFTELGQPKKYWGSTEGLKEPVCERYSFKHNGKLITLDIDKELSDRLELNSEDNFCIDKKILPSDLPEEGIITIRNEEEIFLQKPFTIDNLEEDINKLLDKIKELKEEKGRLEKENKEIKINRKHWENKYRKEQKKSKELEKKLKIIQQELDKEKFWWDKWIKENDIWFIFPVDNNSFSLKYLDPEGYYQQTIFKHPSPHSDNLRKLKREIKDRIYQHYRNK